MAKKQGDNSPKINPNPDTCRKPLATTSDFERVRRFSEEFIKTYGGHDQIPHGLFVG